MTRATPVEGQGWSHEVRMALEEQPGTGETFVRFDHVDAEDVDVPAGIVAIFTDGAEKDFDLPAQPGDVVRVEDPDLGGYTFIDLRLLKPLRCEWEPKMGSVEGMDVVVGREWFVTFTANVEGE